MKYFAVLTSIILVFISMYFIYLAINSEYIIISVLRCISALVTIYLALPNFKKNNKIPDRVRYWFYYVKPKGIIYFVCTRGIIWFGLGLGLSAWLINKNLGTEENLFLSAMRFLIVYIIMGIFLSFFMWKKNIKEAKRINLMT